MNRLITVGALTGLASLANAQEPSLEPDQEDRVVIDILDRSSTQSSVDPAEDRECEEEQDAARISGEIIVCRRLGDDAAVSGYDSAAAQRRYAERTQGSRTPNVEGAGGSIIYKTDGSVFMVTTGRITVGEAPEGPLIIDIEALPEAPKGSDADRVGKRLPVEPEPPR